VISKQIRLPFVKNAANVKVEAAHRHAAILFQILLTSGGERHSKVQPIIFGVRDRPSVFTRGTSSLPLLWLFFFSFFRLLFFCFFVLSLSFFL